ncbi:TetR/AcrR family transcriptional regulator [Ilumatobacter coccineus]|uniref:Putative TetR family transcriptional regulator n=1 Tax=Ilumatobacter coccineus (strain NBRC 103263 / KCTC 29153 / YM16-304) TaxID=1313172 RepID=A0A6C7E7G5_ILUCY|nr:TetR/AcrR family transcriptional regulator [Ilumatobacter coccineus]BAN00548.1 putative TetR family transcriptional regulator [Ilumatobacter coccineus YM16-304]
MTIDDDGPRRTRMDPEARRGQIMRVAARLFEERPYSEVSISDIATEANIARGLLHHYFGSKRELYLEIVRMSVQTPLVDTPPEALGTAETWATAVDSFLSAIERNPTRWVNSVKVGGAETDDEVAAILDETREIIADQTLLAIGLGTRADEPVVRALLRAWGGFVQELTVEWVGRGRIDRDRARRAMLATLPLLVEQVLPLLDDD